MALSRTAPLRDALTGALPRRPFALRFWDGTEVPATDPGSPTLTFSWTVPPATAQNGTHVFDIHTLVGLQTPCSAAPSSIRISPPCAAM